MKRKFKYSPYEGQSDCEKLLRYMALRGALTRLHAQQEFGNGGSITARIADLRRLGWGIKTDRYYDEQGRAFSKWSLTDQNQIDLIREDVGVEEFLFTQRLAA